MSNGGGDSGSPWVKVLVLLGGIPLLFAMVVDTVAVIGRHVRVPLHGSIELVQAALLLSGAAAMVVATVAGTHAIVTLLISRAPPRPRLWLARANHVLSALFFLALVSGGMWIAADMWLAYEQSELLALPYRPLRLFSNLAIAAVVLVFLRKALERTPS